MLKVAQNDNEVDDQHDEATGGSLLDEIVRDDARAMLAAAGAGAKGEQPSGR